jgi:hypothetical protein
MFDGKTRYKRDYTVPLNIPDSASEIAPEVSHSGSHAHKEERQEGNVQNEHSAETV